MELAELSRRAMEIRAQYAELERARHGRSWTTEEIALGFVGDVGDLMKLVMATNGVRNISDAEAKLAHELADCLWCILVLSHLHGINLESAFVHAMDEADMPRAALIPIAHDPVPPEYREGEIEWPAEREQRLRRWQTRTVHLCRIALRE